MEWIVQVLLRPANKWQLFFILSLRQSAVTAGIKKNFFSLPFLPRDDALLGPHEPGLVYQHAQTSGDGEVLRMASPPRVS